MSNNSIEESPVWKKAYAKGKQDQKNYYKESLKTSIQQTNLRDKRIQELELIVQGNDDKSRIDSLLQEIKGLRNENANLKKNLEETEDNLARVSEATAKRLAIRGEELMKEHKREMDMVLAQVKDLEDKLEHRDDVSQADTASQGSTRRPSSAGSSSSNPGPKLTIRFSTNLLDNRQSTSATLSPTPVSAVDPNLEDSETEEASVPTRQIKKFGRKKTMLDRRAEAMENFKEKAEMYGWFHGRHGEYLFNPDTPGIMQKVLPFGLRELQGITLEATNAQLTEEQGTEMLAALEPEQKMHERRQWVVVDKVAQRKMNDALKEEKKAAKAAARKSKPRKTRKRKVSESSDDDEEYYPASAKQWRFHDDDDDDEWDDSGAGSSHAVGAV